MFSECLHKNKYYLYINHGNVCNFFKCYYLIWNVREHSKVTFPQAPLTLVCFHVKRITLATDTPIVYTTPAFSRSKKETFENAADPVSV